MPRFLKIAVSPNWAKRPSSGGSEAFAEKLELDDLPSDLPAGRGRRGRCVLRAVVCSVVLPAIAKERNCTERKRRQVVHTPKAGESRAARLRRRQPDTGRGGDTSGKARSCIPREAAATYDGRLGVLSVEIFPDHRTQEISEDQCKLVFRQLRSRHQLLMPFCVARHHRLDAVEEAQDALHAQPVKHHLPAFSSSTSPAPLSRAK